MNQLDCPINDPLTDAHYMGEALREARKAWAQQEVPVGAVVVHEGRVIGRAYNQVEMLKDATAHAEMLALTQAQTAMEDWRLNACTLYVTKEPCPMCAGALLHTRIGRVVFGLGDPKAGAMGGAFDLQAVKGLNHRCAVTVGVREAESRALLQEFFRERRLAPNKNDLPLSDKELR
jgi:tRNA(adenine34) deaminase